MKKLLIAVVLFLISGFVNAQMIINKVKIKENKYDKFDSVWSIATSYIGVGEYLSGNNAIAIRVTYFDVQKSAFDSLPHTYYNICFYFIAKRITSISDKGSKVQIQYDNGIVKDYDYKGSFEIISEGALNGLYVNVNIDSPDDILTRPIKSIRIKTQDDSYSCDVPLKKSETIKKCIDLIKEEIQKGKK